MFLIWIQIRIEDTAAKDLESNWDRIEKNPGLRLKWDSEEIIVVSVKLEGLNGSQKEGGLSTILAESTCLNVFLIMNPSQTLKAKHIHKWEQKLGIC